MSQDNYPLIKRCFPDLYIVFGRLTIGGGAGDARHYLRADTLEHELEKAVRVRSYDLKQLWRDVNQNHDCGTGHKIKLEDTEALLIGIEPIVKDTAESLLREMVRVAKFGHRAELDEIADRAKRLLEGK